MNIEIKNIKYSPTLSDDSNAFTANLYVNGKKVCMVSNNGSGSGLDYGIVDPKLKPLLKEAVQWCKQLPPVPVPNLHPEDAPSQVEMDLELYIDRLLRAHLQRQENSKMERKMADTFLYGIPNERYGTIKFKYSFQYMMDLPDGRERITGMLRKYVLPEIAKGYQLLNTNIPEDMILAAGLKKGEYVKPKEELVIKPSKNRKKGPRL
ncbi:hypothetical protein HF324_27555 [Chitinophaga oryzae]|uniref:Uncharacterized protein n=1 Tax=Chitinophaga oryzae TaxID=2725414 RepID=A0AAE6ZLD6_9BACT|nr:hypothetical protein [Chitinophaga oryzae]QJB34882.1 hypothetical protein HF329_27695 [Chitinophaga oryzae]QJB41393.1 hypothetical protein HF324_27555 [Chitinophaga oryzae]